MGRLITNILLIAILIVLIIIGSNYYKANRTQIMLNDTFFYNTNTQEFYSKMGYEDLYEPQNELIPIYLGLILFIIIGITIGVIIKTSKNNALEKYKQKNNGKLVNIVDKK